MTESNHLCDLWEHTIIKIFKHDLEPPEDDILEFITSQDHSDDQLDQVLQTYQAYQESQSDHENHIHKLMLISLTMLLKHKIQNMVL